MTSLKESILEKLSIIQDEPEEAELIFNFKAFAEQVTNLLVDPKTHTPFTISIHGEWGSGKTSLIKKIKKFTDEDIEKDASKKGWKTLEFDAWEYEKLDLVSTLFKKIAKLYPTKGKKLKDLALSFVTIFTDISLRATTNLSFKELQEHLEHLEDEIPTIHKTVENIIGNERLIIFVDDLDRCHTDNVLLMLEGMKMFLNAKGIIFVVAVDLAKVERAWSLRYNSDFGIIEGRDHVEKIFQLRLSLPPKDFEEVEKYIEHLASTLPDDLKRILFMGFPANPRKIKRVLNLIYFVLKGLDNEDFDKKMPMAVIWCIITSSFPNLSIQIKENVYALLEMSMICYNFDQYSDFIEKWNYIETAKNNRSNFAIDDEHSISHEDFSIMAFEGLKIAKSSPIAFELLQALGAYFNLALEQANSPDQTLKKARTQISYLQSVIGNAGMVGI